jgi:hypothetical protein
MDIWGKLKPVDGWKSDLHAQPWISSNSAIDDEEVVRGHHPDGDTFTLPRNGSHSALLMIEYCYADDTDECKDVQEMSHVLHSRFNDRQYVTSTSWPHMNSIFLREHH